MLPALRKGVLLCYHPEEKDVRYSYPEESCARFFPCPEEIKNFPFVSR